VLWQKGACDRCFRVGRTGWNPVIV